MGLPEAYLSAALVTVGLVLLCWLVLAAARQQLPRVSFVASALRPADSEVVGFLVAYLLPLVSTPALEFDYWILGFVAVILSIVVWGSNAYSFNPLLTTFGYNFYEVTNADGVTYLLATKRHIRRTADITSVVELTQSLTLDVTAD